MIKKKKVKRPSDGLTIPVVILLLGSLAVWLITSRQHDAVNINVAENTSATTTSVHGWELPSIETPMTYAPPEIQPGTTTVMQSVKFLFMLAPGEMVFVSQDAFAAEGELHFVDSSALGTDAPDAINTVCVTRRGDVLFLCGGEYPFWIGSVTDTNRDWAPLIG